MVRIEIDQTQLLVLRPALGVVKAHGNAVAQQTVRLAVGGDQTHGLAPVCQAGQRCVHHRFRNVGVQFERGCPQAQR